MDAWISGVSASRAPMTIQRMAGMLANVGVRTCTLLGLFEFAFHDTLYMISPRGASARLVAVPAVKIIFLSSPVSISPGGILVSAWRRILQLSMISSARTSTRARTSPSGCTGKESCSSP